MNETTQRHEENHADRQSASNDGLGFKHKTTYRHWLSPWRVIWILFKWQLGFRGKVCPYCGFSEAAHFNYSLEFDMDNYPCTFETLHKAQLDKHNV